MLGRRFLLSVSIVMFLMITVFASVAAARDNGNSNGKPDHGRAKPTVFTTRLTGAAEVPGPGDPDGRGQARIALHKDQGAICFVIHVRDIARPTAAHIHVITANNAGPVLVTLLVPGATFVNGKATGCVTAKAEDIDNITANPTRYYVNVHNAEFPAGALRGNLKN